MATQYKYRYSESGIWVSEVDFGQLIIDATTNPLLLNKNPQNINDFVAYVEGATPNGLGETIDIDSGAKQILALFTPEMSNSGKVANGTVVIRSDYSVDATSISTSLSGAVIESGHVFLVTVAGTALGRSLIVGDAIVANIDNPSLLTTSTDWSFWGVNDEELTPEQSLLFSSFTRSGTRFDAGGNVFVSPNNVVIQMNQGLPGHSGNYILAPQAQTQQTYQLSFGNNNVFVFTALVGGKLTLNVQFSQVSSSGFIPSLVSLNFVYDSGNPGETTFSFDLTHINADGGMGPVSIDIPNADYSGIVGLSPSVTLVVNDRGASFVGNINILGLTNSLKGTLHDSIQDIAREEAMRVEQLLDTKLLTLGDKIDQSGEALNQISNRLSPLQTVTDETPYADALFLDDDGVVTNPVPELSSMFDVSAANPRFTGGDIALWVAVNSNYIYTFQNINQSTDVPLDNATPNIQLLASRSSGGDVYFIFKISSLTSGHVYEIERASIRTVAQWGYAIDALQENIREIKAQLKHAALNLPDAVISVIQHATVDEQTNATINPTQFNEQLAGLTNTTQTVYFEPTPVPPSGGEKNSKPFSDRSGTAFENKKLVYTPNVGNPPNGTYLKAYDGTVNRDLITSLNGVFYGKQFIAAIPAGTRDEDALVYFNESLLSLTFIHNPTQGHNEEGEAFTIDVPAGRPLTLNYTDEANFDTQTSGTYNLAANQENANFTVRDANITVTVSLRRNGDHIQAEVTMNNIPGGSLTEYAITFSGTTTRTVTTPGTDETIRDVRLESAHDGYQVFGIKQSASNTVILVGDETEVDTNYLFTTLFGSSHSGYLVSTVDTTTFFDYRDFLPIAPIVSILENHAALPEFGLFITTYNHQTTFKLNTQLEAKNSSGNDVLLGDITGSTVYNGDGTKGWTVGVENGAFTLTEI